MKTKKAAFKAANAKSATEPQVNLKTKVTVELLNTIEGLQGSNRLSEPESAGFLVEIGLTILQDEENAAALGTTGGDLFWNLTLDIPKRSKGDVDVALSEWGAERLSHIAEKLRRSPEEMAAKMMDLGKEGLRSPQLMQLMMSGRSVISYVSKAFVHDLRAERAGVNSGTPPSFLKFERVLLEESKQGGANP